MERISLKRFIQINVKDCGGCGLTLLQSCSFELPLEILYFHLLHWSDLNNWFVWKMPLRSGVEDNYPHMFLEVDWWSSVLFESSYSTHPNRIIRNSIFWWLTQINMTVIRWGLTSSIYPSTLCLVFTYLWHKNLSIWHFSFNSGNPFKNVKYKGAHSLKVYFRDIFTPAYFLMKHYRFEGYSLREEQRLR